MKKLNRNPTQSTAEIICLAMKLHMKERRNSEELSVIKEWTINDKREREKINKEQDVRKRPKEQRGQKSKHLQLPQ